MTAEVSGVDVNAVGVVLMVAGAVGLVWGLLAAASIRPFGRREANPVAEQLIPLPPMGGQLDVSAVPPGRRVPTS